MDQDKKDVGKWWMWITLLIIGSSVLFMILNAVGLVGKTVVERKVFESSYQYSEARKSEIGVFQAQLAEINVRLGDPAIDQSTRTALESQAAALRVQLNVARSK